MMDVGHEPSQPAELTVAQRTGIPDEKFILMSRASSVEEFLNKFVDVDHPHSLPHPSTVSPLGWKKHREDPDDRLDDYDEDDHHNDDDEEGRDVYVESLFRGYGSSPDASSSASSSSPPSAAGSSTSASNGSRNRSNKKIHPPITSPAGCDVEKRTVEIEDKDKPHELYYPWCVRVPRCSGCCPSSRLRCVATNISHIEINVSRF